MSVFADEDLFKDFEEEEEQESESDEEIEENTRYQQEYNELLRENKRIKRTLKKENEELKKTLRILTRPKKIKIKDPITDGPIAHVIMFNNIIARKYRQKIQDFFYDLSTRKLSADDSEEVTELQPLYLQYLAPEEKTSRKVSSHRSEATVKAYQAFSSIQVYRKFFIDHLGEPLLHQDPSVSDWFQPEYDGIISSPLDGDTDSGESSQRKKLQRICFNCGGVDHQMKDCEKPRDHRAVNERRQKFMEEVARCHDGSPSIRIGGPRYHQEEEEAESNKNRFANFKPGVISKCLQEALGISEDDIPPYIYNMRIHGYPPGHLQNARMVDSSLALYHEQEKRAENRQEGYVPVNVEKIIGYPGFNIPPLPGQNDEFRKFNAPPMTEAHSKTAMCFYFEHKNSIHKNRAEEKEKQKEVAKVVVDRDMDMEEIDMEMEDDDNEEDSGSKGEEVVTDKMEDEVEEGEVNDDVGSLTEDELNLERERLLKALHQENQNDSDYRTIESKDQDYRINPILIDLTETTDSEKDQKDNENEIQREPLDFGEDKPQAMLTEIKEENFIRNTAERTVSSDTDYRLDANVTPEQCDTPASPNGEGPKGATVLETEVVHTEEIINIEDEGSTSSNEEEQKLPGREKFAIGITQFDAYYSESKSQGVYKKLKTLLKHSPRRKDK